MILLGVVPDFRIFDLHVHLVAQAQTSPPYRAIGPIALCFPGLAPYCAIAPHTDPHRIDICLHAKQN